MIWDLIIIGGGVAGLAAASEVGKIKTLLIEKNNHCGTKLLLSGAGQCNITHAGSVKDFEDKFGGKWRFVRSSLSDFDNNDLVNRFESYDVPMVTLESGKIFPKSLRALDILEALEKKAELNSVKINKGESVVKVEIIDDLVYVKTNKADYVTKKLIVATGGMTYRKTGSTGDGYRFAKMLGADVVQAKFALAPIYVNNHELSLLTGISFENAKISHWSEGKKIGNYSGDLLITHFGYSGPVIINNSRYMNIGDVLKINFTSYDKKEDLEKEFLSLLSKDNKKSVRNIINSEFLPRRVTDELFRILNLDENIKSSELKKEDRKRIVSFMFEYEVNISAVGKEHIAMVTAGGVSTDSLSKKTMALKDHKQIYFVGECVDVDGDTGGYNIQFAFSSGIAAARSVMKELNHE